MLRRLTRDPRFQAAATGVLGAYLAFVYRTTRWRIEGYQHVVQLAGTGSGSLILAFWHEALPVMSRLWVVAREATPLRAAHVLVSRHRDGRLIGDIVGRFGVGMVYGSSSRGGAAGLRSLLRLLREPGQAIAITPDGPRGPRREAAPGVAQMAAVSGLPVLVAGGAFSLGFTLPSWDRMRVPLPFGRGVIVLEPPRIVPRDGAEAALPAIAAALNAASDAAERAVGRKPA
jgi:lysophospholipid acyltransferase (LPLAT)-like uncharacterized protein